MSTTKKVTNKSEPSRAKKARTHSDVSESSTEEIGIIHQQLEGLTENISHLREDLKSMLTKDDIERLITKTVTTIMSKMEKQMIESIESKVNEKSQKLNEKIDALEFENNMLREQIKKYETKTNSTIEQLEEKLRSQDMQIKEAVKRSNFNEQYSRKNNLKIMNIKEEKGESIEGLTTKTLEILNSVNASLSRAEILAIHRIPGRPGTEKPVLLKLLTNDAKSRIMRKRADMKAAGYRLVDDVTRSNQQLISRLSINPLLTGAWYFNGSVFGADKKGKRHKFDLYDNVEEIFQKRMMQH